MPLAQVLLDLMQEAKSCHAESAKQVFLALVLVVTISHLATHSYTYGGVSVIILRSLMPKLGHTI